MKEALTARTELLKKKFVNDKETKIQIENELNKIMVQDLEDARDLNIRHTQKIAQLESERDMYK